MKTASAPLIALLATRQFTYARLYQFTLIGGSTLYYTSCDTDILWGGNTYISGGKTGLLFDTSGNKAQCHWKFGVEVDTLAFTVIPNGATINSQQFLSAVTQGVFDGAELTVLDAYWGQQGWQKPIIPVGVVNMFVGRVADIAASRSQATFNVNSHLELLNQNLPRTIYQAGCCNTLYDTACTLNQASFSASGSVTSAGYAYWINTALSQATGYFDHGKITFTSGANNGLSRTVKGYWLQSPCVVQTISPFPNVPAIGDTFTIYSGCDKTQATCSNKFGNLANFRGFPYIPDNTTAV